MNRLEAAVNNLINIAQYTTESRSRIEDTEYSATASDLAKSQIIQQAATAVLAQANMDGETVMKLLGNS